MVLLIADVSAGTDPAGVQGVIEEELDRLAQDGPAPAELDAARAQNERSWLSALAGLDHRADTISHYATLYDDAGYLNTMLDELFAVDAEQIREATRRWLRPQAAATIAYLRAEPQRSAAELAAVGASELGARR